jgi:hydrogenase expression/formation protein HypD
VASAKIADPQSCQCGEVLKGVIKPWQCKVFGSACTPERPLGALMVSSEGACTQVSPARGQMTTSAAGLDRRHASGNI